jgi:aspartyl-tRNA(Asn)/glutamyl-tRNA(Gln) amidotransferase subunit B
MTEYQPVIGLEVHVELATATKLFCSCPNVFGSEPNTNVCPVCLGLPGSLPVLNEQVVEFALRVGEAFSFTVPPQSIFHRKNYFYPDMPKDFQTSQFDEPICIDGALETTEGPVRIERAHMEEDTGKTTHVGGGGRITDAEYSLVDYNRAGVPLMEIVSRPDMHSAEHARAYVSELRAVLQAIAVSDVKMEEGSMRVDANVSLRPVGQEKLGTRAEIKNMNSLRSLGRAITYEIERQTDLLEAGERVVQETRHWNEDDGRTHSMRSKEEAFDYRYFPEPDLVPVRPSEEWKDEVRAGQPELPASRRRHLIEAWGLSPADAAGLVERPELRAYAESAATALTAGTPRDVVNWVLGELQARLNESGSTIDAIPFPPAALAELVSLVGDGTLSRNMAKDVLVEGVASGARPAAIVAARGLAQVNDADELATLIDTVLADNAPDVASYRDTDDDGRRKKIRGALMGKVRAANRDVNMQRVGELLDERLA